MLVMAVAGGVAVVFGLMALVSPKRLKRWNTVMSRQVTKLEPMIEKYRVSVGLILVSVGVFCLASAYEVWLRLH